MPRQLYRSWSETLTRAVALLLGVTLLLSMSATPPAFAAPADNALRVFDVPAGDAGKSLKVFSQQAGRGVIFSSEALQGLQTHAVRGEFTPREAIEQMLNGTGLVIGEEERTGAFAVRKGVADPNAPRAAPSPTRDTRPNRSPVPNVTEEAVRLSPFVVAESENVGYLATSTLAGTRIKTDLRDLGSAISVVTPEFLRDTGATNVEEFLAYTAATEIGGMQGNFSGADLSADASRFNLDEQRREPQTAARVRGIGAPNFTRGFFSTSVPIDTYNTSGITISRGANSLLFGLGSAAGVIDNSVSSANVRRNAYEATSRIGAYDSHRETFKINQVLVPNRLAFLISGLNKEERYRQTPARDQEQRLYGAIEAVLLRNEKSRILGPTTLRGSIEFGEGDRIPPTTLPPMPAWDSFFEPPFDFRPYTGIDYFATYDWLARSWTKWRTVDTRRILVSAGPPATYRPGWYESPAIAAAQGHPELLMPVYSTPHVFEQIVLAFSGTGAPSLGSGSLAGFQGWITAANQNQSPHVNTRLYSEGEQNIGFKGSTLTDRNVFDYKNLLLTGDQQQIQRKFDSQLLTLEQQLLRGHAGFEGTFGRETYRLDYRQPFGGAGRNLNIYVDTTEYLSDGMRNPNVGRAFMLAPGDASQWRITERENQRVTGFLDFDFKDFGFLGRLGRWMGRHRLTGLWQKESQQTTGLNYNMYWSGVGFDVNRTVKGTTSNAWTDNLVTGLIYISDDLRGKEVRDVRLHPVAMNAVRDGDTFTVRYYDRTTSQFATGIVRANKLANGGVASGVDVTSKALAWQSYLLDRHLVGLAGWRSDTIENFRAIRTNARSAINEYLPENLEINNRPATTQTGDTFTWSIVGHVPGRLVDRLPLLSSVSTHFSKAENFTAIAERHDIFNQAIPSPQGATTEYGVTLGLARNKWFLKLNRFETGSAYVGTLGTETGRGISYINLFINNWDVGYKDQRTYPAETQEFYKRGYRTYDDLFKALINLMPEPARSIYAPYRNAAGNWVNRSNIAGLSSTTDVVAKGWEAELTGNPTPNWRVSLNAVKLETVRANTAGPMLEYANQVIENLGKANLLGVTEGPNSIVRMEARWGADLLSGILTARAKDGTVSQEQCKWRVNLVSNYDFTGGRLKGFGVGGAFRWQSKVATGYPVAVTAGGVLPQIDRAFFGPPEFNGDFWLSYSHKLSERIRWKIQLNVRNLVGSQDLIPVYTNPDGRNAVYRMAPDRDWFLTNTFSF